jgi:hypothetical protein
VESAELSLQQTGWDILHISSLEANANRFEATEGLHLQNLHKRYVGTIAMIMCVCTFFTTISTKWTYDLLDKINYHLIYGNAIIIDKSLFQFSYIWKEYV